MEYESHFDLIQYTPTNAQLNGNCDWGTNKRSVYGNRVWLRFIVFLFYSFDRITYPLHTP